MDANRTLDQANRTLRRRHWIIVPAVVGLIAVMAIGTSVSNRRPNEIAAHRNRPASQVAERDGEEKKTSPGILFADQVTLVETSSVSLEALTFDSERVWSVYDDWEPAIAVDPGSEYVYQLTTRYNDPQTCGRCAAPVIVFRRSKDGGATWGTDHILAVTRKSQNDPQIEVATDGTIYVAWLNDYRPGIKFMKSSDHGDTWSTPIAITGNGTKPNWSDRPILAISPDGRNVYIAFNASDSYVVSSHNFGNSFAEPVKTSHDQRYWFHSGGAVSGNGDVYFAAADYSQGYTGDTHINVIKSTDSGVSWTTARVDTSKEMPHCAWAEGCYFGFLGPSAALAIDKAGKIMIAYNANDTAGDPLKMYVRTSPDGVTWSDRQEVSNGSATVNNGFPALAAGPKRGDFRLVWQDDRNGSTMAWNTWYRRTTDGGAMWGKALRMSDLGSGAPYKTAAGYQFPYGDYFEIAVGSDGTNYLIWGEGSSYAGPGGSWYTRGK